MKNILTAALFSLSLISLYSQETFTNRYAMMLSKDPDGSYTLQNREKYAAIVDLNKIPDLLIPFTPKKSSLINRDFESIRTVEYIYKSYPTYELKLAVDFPESEGPRPFIIYIHGGGWARGDFNANRDFSKYCAKNAGIAGIRISYTLADKPGANIEVTVEDVKDALRWVQERAKELNIIPDIFGFMGGSAGGHLSAVAAMSVPGTKVLIGVSGIYNLASAKITSKATDPQRLAFFRYGDSSTIAKVSPVNLIPDKNLPACYLVHGTADITVECSQSREFAEALIKKGINTLKLDIYPFYDHNIFSSKSDMKERLFLEAYNFVTSYLK